MILGIDIGGSTTKIVAFGEDGLLKATLQVKASDQITSLYGAVGHLLCKNGMTLGQISGIILTGVGAAFADDDIYGIPTFRVREFEAIGCGGLLLSGLKKALVVSMGTGTAFVRATEGGYVHVGGSGVGGGTLLGLSSKLLKEEDAGVVSELAKHGDPGNVDLLIHDISRADIPSLPSSATAANFGHIKPSATRADLAAGLINMVFQTAGIMAAFACMNTDLHKVVVTGSLATLPQAQEILSSVGDLYGLKFIIPENAIFATAIGAAELHFHRGQVSPEEG